MHWFTRSPQKQTIQTRHKELLEKAQEELEGTNASNKLSLKATLTDQIKEQESSLTQVREVRKRSGEEKHEVHLFGVAIDRASKYTLNMQT